MGRHVQAVGDQGHRAERQPPADLGRHHGRAQADHQPGLARVSVVVLAQEHVVVAQLVDEVGLHGWRSSQAR